MISRMLALTYTAEDPAKLAQFWAGVLDRDIVDDAGAVLLPGGDTQLDLRFVAGLADRVGRDRMHLHLTSSSLGDQRQTVATALALGGRHHDVGQLPEEDHVVLAGPDGNEFCVIEPGNSWLEGCGLLGELTCDGTREVGLFWAAALGWPLVWDRDEETAVQSPRGGTKISWGGRPVAPFTGRPGQRFNLVTAEGDLAAEIARFLSLGATRLEAGDDGATLMADPDANEFHLTPA